MQEMIQYSGFMVYKNSLKNYNQLTDKETNKLFKKNTKKARDMIVKCNIPLVIRAASKFYNPAPQRIDFLDIIQEGTIGLMACVKRFNVSMGYRFSTYAVSYINGYITRFLENSAYNVRVPVHVQEVKRRFNKLKKADNDLTDDFIMHLIAKENNVPVETIKSKIEYKQETCFLDQESWHSNFIAEAFDESACNKIDASKLFGMLKPRNAYILKRRMEGITLQEIGDEVCLTKERVRQIEDMSLRKLRAMVKKTGIL